MWATSHSGDNTRRDMKKKIVLFFFLLPLLSFAQQDAQYSMYMFNGMAINPAYAGSLEGLSASALYRLQWAGIEGAPRTIFANVHKPFMDHKIGAGLTVVNDQVGVMDRTALSLAGSYHLEFPTFRVALGIQGTYSQYSVGLGGVQHSLDGSADPTFATNIKQSTINFGAGAFAYAENWYAGISAPHIMRNLLSEELINTTNSSYEVPHFFAQAGYIYAVNPMLDIKPNILLKNTPNAPMNVDINLNAYYRKMIGVGVGYRTSQALIAMLECSPIPNFRFAYAYDYTLSNLNTYAGATHEIMLRYDMGVKGVRISPRLY